MGRVVVTEFISLDGVIEAPGGGEDYKHGGWSFKFDRGDDGNKFKLDELAEADAQLLGRRTYEGFAAAWPGRKDDAGFADKMNSMPKYVVSNSLEKADWENTTVLSGDAAEQVAKLRESESGDILVAGSAQLVQTLVANGLVDELRLMVFPIVLGSGKRLFGDSDTPARLKLVDTKPVGSDGVVILTYAPADAA